MKCLQLALGLALVCGLQAIDIPQATRNLDLQKVAGMWHSMPMVASDISLLDSETAPLRVYVQELRPTPENNLEIILHKREDNKCVEKKVFAEKTDCAAKFNIKDPEENEVFVLDTDYDNYLFFCVESTAAAQPRLMCQYLARTLKVDNEVVQKFDKTLKTLPVHIRLFLNPTRVEEQCRV